MPYWESHISHKARYIGFYFHVTTFKKILILFFILHITANNCNGNPIATHWKQQEQNFLLFFINTSEEIIIIKSLIRCIGQISAFTSVAASVETRTKVNTGALCAIKATKSWALERNKALYRAKSNEECSCSFTKTS